MVLKKNDISSVVAGICGSVGSLFGKLMHGLPGYDETPLLLSGIFLILMLIFNTTNMTLFVKSLQYSESSLRPTVVNATTNYLFSAFFGILLFNEKTTFSWWCGIMLIIIGLLFIAKDSETKKSIDNSFKNK